MRFSNTTKLILIYELGRPEPPSAKRRGHAMIMSVLRHKVFLHKRLNMGVSADFTATRACSFLKRSTV